MDQLGPALLCATLSTRVDTLESDDEVVTVHIGRGHPDDPADLAGALARHATLSRLRIVLYGDAFWDDAVGLIVDDIFIELVAAPGTQPRLIIAEGIFAVHGAPLSMRGVELIFGTVEELEYLCRTK